jgi:hypothetical protein
MEHLLWNIDELWIIVAPKRRRGKATPGVLASASVVETRSLRGDVIARAEEQLPGQPLLVPFVRSGRLVREETIEQMRRRARAELLALPASLRELVGEGHAYSERCRAALEAVDARAL